MKCESRAKPSHLNQPTVMAEIDGIKFYEVIDRNAFAEAKMDDVVLVENHQGRAAAKTKNRTLELRHPMMVFLLKPT
jgi:phage head maturation protease